eukprot:CAMPEP_0117517040 /NCGR_PEP_ID=MMETSP0784-20121206/31404_1 /TAXON_ID=39447 /ORGANISM="" /LENGTH=490 /DNA_ID=CAMNT_0005312903 /DNA_START=176 /DNA_END=1648 /DNA_ORIENTATION=-
MSSLQVATNSLQNTGGSQCESLMKDLFNVAKVKDSKFHLVPLETPANIGMRIGQVLGAQYNRQFKEAGGYDADGWFSGCCGAGTEYDHFIHSKVNSKFDMESITDKHMLIVVDLQQDFTTGSFGQPCWSSGSQRFSSFSSNISKLAEAFVRKGGMVVATKDFHPVGHCSFEHQDEQKHCKNSKDPLIHEDRYQNDFPPHCAFKVLESGKAKPLPSNEAPFCTKFGGNDLKLPFCTADHTGADFEKDFAEGLKGIFDKKYTADGKSWTGADKVRVVYKGFNEYYDSFSGIAHLKTATDNKTTGTVEPNEAKYTGGYALPENEMKEADCLTPDGLESDKCHPSEDQMADPASLMHSLLDIIDDFKITHVVTVGLVYDFCVRETSIFAREAQGATHPVTNKKYEHLEVTMLADLTSPAFDGKPGAPYMCEKGEGGPEFAGSGDDFRVPIDKDGGKEDWPYCKQGLGTTSSYEAVLSDYEHAGVEVATIADSGP